MKKKPLGCFSLSALIALGITVLITGAVAVASGGAMFSPGTLGKTGEGEVLQGVSSHNAIGGDCAACHVEPWATETMADRCQVCHTEITQELADATLLHGALLQHNPQIGCRDCHHEHRGADAPLVEMTAATFPHDVVGFSLAAHQAKSDHSPFACADCHTEDITQFEQSTCRACHQEIDAAFMPTHRTAYGDDCLACHDGLESYTADFDHSKTDFALLGEHAETECAQCHTGARTSADFQNTVSACVACHLADDAHDGQFGTDCSLCHTAADWESATVDHTLVGNECASCHLGDDAHDGAYGTACAACHSTDAWEPATVDHALVGNECASCHLADDAHDGAYGTACADCHSTEAWEPATFDHALAGNDCASCHLGDDAHDGAYGTACADCHSTDAWEPAAFDHALAGNECASCHLGDDAHDGAYGTACADCHSTDAWEPATFDHALAGNDCASCHLGDDAHDGAYGTACADCHSTDAWQPATFDHNLSGFPLTGAHSSVPCESCHTNGGFGGLSSTCVACHAEPAYHLGAFGTACADCHSTTAWSPAEFNREHTFPLNHGESGVSSCVTCHPSTFTSYTCYTCHEHTEANIRAKHLEEGITSFQNCVECHADGREHDGDGGGDGGGDD